MIEYVYVKRKKSYRCVKIGMGIMSDWFQWFYMVSEHITYMLYDKIRYIVEDTSLTF